MSNIKAREWYWVPHPSRVWVAVLVQSISKNSCWVTTVEDDQGFELDITECPFLPLNPRTVDDMTSLLYLHEAGILENLYERSKPQNQRPYTYVSNVLIAINPLRNILSLPMEVNLYIFSVYICIAHLYHSLIKISLSVVQNHILLESLNWRISK